MPPPLYDINDCSPSFIAFIDDDKYFIESLRARIRQNSEEWDIRYFNSARAALHELESKETAVIISDRYMPDIDGIEFCEKLRHLQSEPNGPSFYFIMLSQMCDTEHLIEGLDRGADDYLSKPFDPKELLARIRVGLRLTQIEHSLKQSCQRYHRLATLDALTGILNRRGGTDRVFPELARVKRGHQGLSISLIDIDYFKQINDSYGHPVGDRILQEISQELLRCIREYDILARWGGEEFLLVLPDTNEESGLAITERIRSRINRMSLLPENNEKKSISVSIGSVYVPPMNSTDFDTILQTVDIALYQAKSSGRNRIVLAKIDTNKPIERRVSIP